MQYDLETEALDVETYEGYRINAFIGEITKLSQTSVLNTTLCLHRIVSVTSYLSIQ